MALFEGEGTTRTRSWTPPAALAAQGANSASVRLTFTLTTYCGSATVGSTTKTVSLAIPASTVTAPITTNTYELITVSGIKTWVDGENEFNTRPSSITVNLLANGDTVDTATVTADDNWAYSFSDLPKLDASGNELYNRQFDVPMQQNHITWLSGAFFNGSGSSSTTIGGVTVNTDWAGETHLTF